MSPLTLGSLFDGSGGFPLAALHTGIRPVWASEVEPFPILVTTTRLPEVAHLGDVSQIDGAAIKPVDVITFGSPCQDLSVAGRQFGLAGKRSGLFFQAIRIIKEMRKASNGRYPRFAVWENVPGAFSSNKGHDFADVLTSLIRLQSPTVADVPVPAPRWADAGCVVADGCSVAWRVFDAQHFGLAQRRRRIYLICDFAGRSAPEILFEPASLPRHPQSCGTQEQDHAHTPERSVGGRSSQVMLLDHHPQDSRLTVNSSGVVQTPAARMGNSPTNAPILLDAPEERRVFGLNSIHQSRAGGGHYGYEAAVSKTLDLKGGEPTCNQGGMVILEPVYAASKADYFTRATKDQAGALLACDYTDSPMVASSSLRPRRLTPVECTRLQGFPDTWCHQLALTDPTDAQLDYWVGVWEAWNRIRSVRPRSRKQVAAWLADPASDSAQYKLWGNAIALPVAEHVLKRVKNMVDTTG
ncbi:DNA cytosine methyltransferase [Gleimia hominis]|uniref:DNA (cytosine-5-)-methyltransferase n=1 Tax=Gleimia hominis TaxID=595468 RepID=A0ABU3ICS5_9ACTO|nr:DNA cytosine methyltransferase [Gleimia hominis]MDT3768176.1 DNA cytosine methyltransferase [Gleimia hominis]